MSRIEGKVPLAIATGVASLALAFGTDKIVNELNLVPDSTGYSYPPMKVLPESSPILDPQQPKVEINRFR